MNLFVLYSLIFLFTILVLLCRVLKPPGGASSDIFGAAPEETSPRRVKTHNQSQLGSALFGKANGTDNAHAILSPRSNKPGNDSYNRLFGPPDAPPITPNAKKHKDNNTLLNGESLASTRSSSAAMSRAKSIISNGNNLLPDIANGFPSNGNNLSNDITGKGQSRTEK
ncbi:microtubule-associated protein jupiter-like protein [Lasius niger]|uniref:Microtubule-associated protein jupiter-like protein n=1 Tax=Lasius niger TaxID=67767 RepID=A0A0J7KY71_LASNI|nr:microtubule-associated protein jupiter-like protein [Lasius niger]